MEELIKELIERVTYEKVDDVDKDLLAAGILDSFDIVELVEEIESELGIEIDVSYIKAEHFKSIRSLVDMISMISGEK